MRCNYWLATTDYYAVGDYDMADLGVCLLNPQSKAAIGPIHHVSLVLISSWRRGISRRGAWLVVLMKRGWWAGYGMEVDWRGKRSQLLQIRDDRGP